MDENNRELEFDVQMDSKILYDYLICHAYSGASGILGTCIGVMLFLMFANNHNPLCLVFGIVLILYIPIELKFHAKKIMVLNSVYKKPIHYNMGAEGVTVSQGEASQTLEWSGFTKAINTKHSIVLYSGKNNASIFPRKQLQEEIPGIIAIIVENMDPKKVKIKW